MATKKKVAAKPGAAKKVSSPKTTVSAKKAVSSAKATVKGKPAAKAPAKPVAKAAVSKKATKPVAKTPVKPTAKSVAKPVVAKKVAAKKVEKPVPKAAPKPAPKSPAPVVVKPMKAEKKEKAVKSSKAQQVAAPKKMYEKSMGVLKSLPKKAEPRPAAPKQIIVPPPFKKPVPKEVAPVRTGKLVIPDIKTKTVRKYEPDFTKSVLDTPMYEQTGPTQRYSDVDLEEFRELINKKLEAAKKELAYLQGLITRKDEMGGDNDDARYMTMEDGSMSMEREQLSQMASRQITFIDHLEKAIMRIENKTYGICRVTGKLIDKARLRAVPHATLSIEAKQMQHK